jgi:excisionase family DNA binding protein
MKEKDISGDKATKVTTETPAVPVDIDNGDDEFMTVTEVAVMMRVTERSVFNVKARKELRAYKFGGALRFRRSDVLAYAARKAEIELTEPVTVNVRNAAPKGVKNCQGG